MMKKNSRIYVAGHTGLLGSAVVRMLTKLGYSNLCVADSMDFDLRDQMAAEGIFYRNKDPEYIFLCAAKVGGIQANIDSPADFLEDNLRIQMNVMAAARNHNVKKLLFVGSSCMYPRASGDWNILHISNPLDEKSLFQGHLLESTNEAYAYAKLIGVKMVQYYRQQYGVEFISAIPCNLYGPNDNYDPTTSHFIPALIRKLHDLKKSGRKTLNLWGDGTPRRELMYSDDCADALIHMMNYYEDDSPVNIGTGKDHSITDIARIAAKTLGIERLKISYDKSRPNGVHSKRLDVSKMSALGWKPKTTLQQGIKKTYAHYVQTPGK